MSTAIRRSLLVVGRPETLDLLQSAPTGALSSARIVVHRMASATQDDVNAYILHRMRSAGLRASLFTAAARMLVAKLADGSFARVNLLCQGVLVLLHKRRLQHVDEKLVIEANAIFGRSAVAGWAASRCRHAIFGEETIRRQRRRPGRRVAPDPDRRAAHCAQATRSNARRLTEFPFRVPLVLQVTAARNELFILASDRIDREQG